MTCHLFGAKALPEEMMTYCQQAPQEQTSEMDVWWCILTSLNSMLSETMLAIVLVDLIQYKNVILPV